MCAFWRSREIRSWVSDSETGPLVLSAPRHQPKLKGNASQQTLPCVEIACGRGCRFRHSWSFLDSKPGRLNSPPKVCGRSRQAAFQIGFKLRGRPRDWPGTRESACLSTQIENSKSSSGILPLNWNSVARLGSFLQLTQATHPSNMRHALLGPHGKTVRQTGCCCCCCCCCCCLGRRGIQALVRCVVAIHVHPRLLRVVFWSCSGRRGRSPCPQRLIAGVDSRLFQGSRLFQRLLMQTRRAEPPTQRVAAVAPARHAGSPCMHGTPPNGAMRNNPKAPRRHSPPQPRLPELRAFQPVGLDESRRDAC